MGLTRTLVLHPAVRDRNADPDVAAAKLAEAEKITPGFNSPTVGTLEDEAWRSVRVMVRSSEVIDVMEKLERLGASAIFQTTISNCRL